MERYLKAGAALPFQIARAGVPAPPCSLTARPAASACSAPCWTSLRRSLSCPAPPGPGFVFGEFRGRRQHRGGQRGALELGERERERAFPWGKKGWASGAGGVEIRKKRGITGSRERCGERTGNARWQRRDMEAIVRNFLRVAFLEAPLSDQCHCAGPRGLYVLRHRDSGSGSHRRNRGAAPAATSFPPRTVPGRRRRRHPFLPRLRRRHRRGQYGTSSE